VDTQYDLSSLSAITDQRTQIRQLFEVQLGLHIVSYSHVKSNIPCLINVLDCTQPIKTIHVTQGARRRYPQSAAYDVRPARENDDRSDDVLGRLELLRLQLNKAW